jgi:hypothetical protein
MHPFGSVLAAREWLSPDHDAADRWRALHARPDAPPYEETARERLVARVIRAIRGSGGRRSGWASAGR